MTHALVIDDDESRIAIEPAPPRHSCTRGSASRWTGARGPAAALALLATALASPARAQAPNLGTAADFAVLGGSTVTNTGSSVLIGNLGVSPGSAIVGFPLES